MTWELMCCTSEKAVLRALEVLQPTRTPVLHSVLVNLEAVLEAVRGLLDVEVPGDYMGIRIHLRRMAMVGLALSASPVPPPPSP